MEKRELILYVLLFLLGWLSYLVVRPFLGYIIMGLLLAFLFYPAYARLKEFMPERLASIAVLTVTLLCIILPTVYLTGTLITEGTAAYTSLRESGLTRFDQTSISDYLHDWLGIDVRDQVAAFFERGRDFAAAAIPSIVTETGVFLLGMFILFFTMYFGLKEGASWFESVSSWVPMTRRHKNQTMILLKRQARALLYGQIGTSVLVGVVVGFFFWLFGVPNGVFWSFVAILVGIIPVLGAFMIYVPAGIWLGFTTGWLPALTMVGLISVVQFLIDNILRPKLVSTASEIHPALVILGALGGIVLMGLVGFLVGPLILSFFFTLLNEHRTT